MILSRRKFFAGASALLVAPALVRVSSIMPIKAAPAAWWSAMMASHDVVNWFAATDAWLLHRGGAISVNRKYAYVRVQTPTVSVSGPTNPQWTIMGAPSLSNSIIKL